MLVQRHTILPTLSRLEVSRSNDECVTADVVDELHDFRVGTFIMKVLVILLNGLKLDQIA